MIDLKVVCIFSLASFAYGCYKVQLSSSELGTVRFIQLPMNVANENSRPCYVSEKNENPIYMYHSRTSDKKSGNGRWVVNAKLGAHDDAMAYCDSWAAAPHLITVSDPTARKSWMIPSGRPDGEWDPDRSVQISCVGEDKTLYFESNPNLQPKLTGIYLERYIKDNSGKIRQVHAKIPMSELEKDIYLFKYHERTWLIGEQLDVDSGYAFSRDETSDPRKIKSAWSFSTPNANTRWVVEGGRMLTFQMASNTHKRVNTAKMAHIVPHVPAGQTYYTLHNDVPMPAVGLGTGGIGNDRAYEVFVDALKLGYRLFDLAREYQNEHIMASALRATRSVVERGEVFLITKVWPTELGFDPTTHAVRKSLEELGTTYIDLYLLHWPSCDRSVTWMHCENAIDPHATWRESWRALEKAYVEGHLQSIGVSNFNIQQLRELEEFAVVLPHVVQNWAEPGNLDLEVREWCHRHRVIYQPYASMRNLNKLPRSMKQTITEIANDHHTNAYAATLRFFLQTGACMIPRSTRKDHLENNLKVFDWSLSQEEMQTLGWNFVEKTAGMEVEL